MMITMCTVSYTMEIVQFHPTEATSFEHQHQLSGNCPASCPLHSYTGHNSPKLQLTRFPGHQASRGINSSATSKRPRFRASSAAPLQREMASHGPPVEVSWGGWKVRVGMGWYQYDIACQSGEEAKTCLCLKRQNRDSNSKNRRLLRESAKTRQKCSRMFEKRFHPW